jgi:hypothetical protein
MLSGGIVPSTILNNMREVMAIYISAICSDWKSERVEIKVNSFTLWVPDWV